MFRLIDSGVLAISTVAIIQFLQLGSPLEFPLTVSLFCFASSIPLAAMQLVIVTMEREFDEKVAEPLNPKGHVALEAVAVFFFYIGTVSMVAYLSLGASIAFAVTSSIGYALLMYMLLSGNRRRLWSMLSGGFVLLCTGVLMAVGYLFQYTFIPQILQWLYS